MSKFDPTGRIKSVYDKDSLGGLEDHDCVGAMLCVRLLLSIPAVETSLNFPAYRLHDLEFCLF